MVSLMTATAAPTVKDQEIISSRLVDSANVNSLADFITSKPNKKEDLIKKENQDFINIFICHLIFYAVFCISLVLHIFIDLGLGSFLKKTFLQLFEIVKKNPVEKTPAFA